MSPHVGTYPIGKSLACKLLHVPFTGVCLPVGETADWWVLFWRRITAPCISHGMRDPNGPKAIQSHHLVMQSFYFRKYRENNNCDIFITATLEMHIFATMVWRVMVMAWGGWNMVKLKTQQARHVATRRRVWCHHLPGWSTRRPRCPHAPGHGEIAAGTNGKCQRQPPLFGGGSRMGSPGADRTTTYK